MPTLRPVRLMLPQSQQHQDQQYCPPRRLPIPSPPEPPPPAGRAARGPPTRPRGPRCWPPGRRSSRSSCTGWRCRWSPSGRRHDADAVPLQLGDDPLPGRPGPHVLPPRLGQGLGALALLLGLGAREGPEGDGLAGPLVGRTERVAEGGFTCHVTSTYRHIISCPIQQYMYKRLCDKIGEKYRRTRNDNASTCT